MVLALPAVFVAGCTLSPPTGPVASEIKTYDSTYTSGVATHQKPETFYQSLMHVPGLGRKEVAISEDTGKSKPYFIEFRARAAYTYGHASVVFGRLDRNGRIPVDSKGVLDPSMVEISGLHPATSDPKVWAKGHAVPVPAETGPSDGDFEDYYVTARYQVNLSESEFRRVVSIVNKHKNRYSYWYAPNYSTNCLGYIGSIAHDMGLEVPTVPLLPKHFVQKLKSMNS